MHEEPLDGVRLSTCVGLLQRTGTDQESTV